MAHPFDSSRWRFYQYMELDELADEMQRQYDRCKLFPERGEGGRIALIELRNLAPQAADYLRQLSRRTPP